MKRIKAWLASITGKTKVKWAAFTFLLSSTAGYIVGVPQEYQDKIIYEVQALCPVEARPLVGHIAHLLAYLCVAYGMIHASHCGPSTHPQNEPDDK